MATKKVMATFAAKTTDYNKAVKKMETNTKSSMMAMQKAHNKLNFKIPMRGIAVMTVAVGLVTAKLIKAASFAEETGNKFNVVFKSQAKETEVWARSFGKNVGRAQDDVKNWLAGIQDTLVPLGVARTKATEMSKALVKLGVDVASFNVKADPEVIENFKAALVGSSRAVLGYGIVLTETELKQELLRRGIKKSLATYTTAEKAMLRFEVMLKATKDAQGDVIRSSQSWANQWKRLKANIADLSGEAGARLIGSLTSVVIKMNEWVSANEDFIHQKFDETLGRVGDELEKIMKKKDVWIKVAKGSAQVATNIITIKGWITGIAGEIIEINKAIAKWQAESWGVYGVMKRIYDLMTYKRPTRSDKPIVSRTGGLFSYGDMGDGARPTSPGPGPAGDEGAGGPAPSFWGGFDVDRTVLFNRHMVTAREEMSKLGAEMMRTNTQFAKQTEFITVANEGWIQLGNSMSFVLSNALTQSGNVFANIEAAFKRMLTQMVADLAARAAIFGLLNLITGGTFGPAVGGIRGFTGIGSFGTSQVPVSMSRTININVTGSSSSGIVEGVRQAHRAGHLDFLKG